MKNGGRAGIKVHWALDNWTEMQRGREITVYIPVYDDIFGSGYDFIEFDESDNQEDDCNKILDTKERIIPLSRNIEHSFSFWTHFVSEAERILSENNIRSAGCANGDLPLGKYVSLRNEAFFIDKVPPNEKGWNCAGHALPFDIEDLKRIFSQHE